MPNLVPQRPFCYLNFISVAKPQKFGNETYDAHVLASSKTYRKRSGAYMYGELGVGRECGGTPCAHNSTTFPLPERLTNCIECSLIVLKTSRPGMITL